MSGRRLKEKLSSGGTALGMFFQYTTNPAVVEILPDAGLDFVVVTCEHNALELADFLGVRWALRSKGIACLARIHSRDPEDVAKAADTFDGVVVPYVEDVELTRRLVAAAAYRPLKGTALERVINEGVWPSAATEAYCRQRCAETFFAAMTESAGALEHLDELCEIPGMDAVFVGPNDLTVSLGIPEERDHPQFIAALDKIIATAERHGIAAGAHFSKLEHAQRLIRQGGRFVPFGSDLSHLQEGIAGSLAALGGGADRPTDRAATI